MGNSSGSNSARSTGVTIKNDTPYTLYRERYLLQHGIWTNYPPKEIPAHQTKKWMSESSGFMTGTEGKVYYEVNGKTFWVSWNNPYAGGNSHNYTTPTGNFTVSRSGGSGDNSYVTFTISAQEIRKEHDWCPTLRDYVVSSMLWYTRPLEKPIAGQFGAKHSWIRVKFVLNTENKPVSTKYNKYVTKGKTSFEFIVERHKGGIYISSAAYRYQQQQYKEASKSYKFNDIDLRAFLVKCCQQNGSYNNRYHVKTKNCHHFAKAIWNMCVIYRIYEEINKWLASMAGMVWSNSSNKPKQTGINDLDPRNEKFEEEDIFKRLEPYSK